MNPSECTKNDGSKSKFPEMTSSAMGASLSTLFHDDNGALEATVEAVRRCYGLLKRGSASLRNKLLQVIDTNHKYSSCV